MTKIKNTRKRYVDKEVGNINRSKQQRFPPTYNALNAERIT
jgi:hypothetical protein